MPIYFPPCSLCFLHYKSTRARKKCFQQEILYGGLKFDKRVSEENKPIATSRLGRYNQSEPDTDRRHVTVSNRYITGHFPLISILLYSLSFALYLQGFILGQFVEFGLYDGMREFFF